MQAPSEETRLLHQFAERLWKCQTELELNQALDPVSIEKALYGFSERPSELVVFYALNLERIRRNLDYLPDNSISAEAVGVAATILGSIYLLRKEFISGYTEQPEGITWTLNPLHRTFDTLEDLKHKNGFLYRLARMVLTRNVGLDPAGIRFGRS